MKLTLIDTKTEKIKQIDSQFSDFWWAEGNGACDCNRATEFNGVAEELTRKQRTEHPELESRQGYCFGCNRFLIIKHDSNEYILEDFNLGYPAGLVGKYCDNRG